MKFHIIACINNKNVLGKSNKLLFNIEDDLKNFKKLSINNVVIMGRKTYESLPKKPLPDRVNIVITTNKNYIAKDCIVVNSIEECVTLCEDKFADKELYVIGGGKIYDEFIKNNLVDKLFLTIVNNDFDGDTFFPAFNNNNHDWKLVYLGPKVLDSKTNLEYYFTIYQKS